MKIEEVRNQMWIADADKKKMKCQLVSSVFLISYF